MFSPLLDTNSYGFVFPVIFTSYSCTSKQLSKHQIVSKGISWYTCTPLLQGYLKKKSCLEASCQLHRMCRWTSFLHIVNNFQKCGRIKQMLWMNSKLLDVYYGIRKKTTCTALIFGISFTIFFHPSFKCLWGWMSLTLQIPLPTYPAPIQHHNTNVHRAAFRFCTPAFFLSPTQRGIFSPH